MDHFPFIFTIFFMLLGPLKIIPTFVDLTRDADIAFKRALAIRGTIIASGLVLFIALAGGRLLDQYHISFDALRIAGGIVLVVAALNTIFRKAPPVRASPKASLLNLAVSPLAVPAIVPPAGVAAIMIVVMLAPEHPGMWSAAGVGLVIIMVLNFLVMYFIDLVTKTPGVMLVLQVLGATLIFMQICIGIDIILKAFRDLGVLVERTSA